MSGVGQALGNLKARKGDVFLANHGTGPSYEVVEDEEGKRLIKCLLYSCSTESYDRYWFTSCHWVLKSRAPVIKYGEWSVGLEITVPKEADIKPLGDGWVAYRLPIKPVVVVEKHWFIYPGQNGHGVTWNDLYAGNSHKITYNIVDGVPDCDSVRMVKL